MPAYEAGLRKGDKILDFNNTLASGLLYDVSILENVTISEGRTIKFRVLKEGVREAVEIDVIPEFSLSRQIRIKYDYLVDSIGTLKLQHLLPDSVQELFWSADKAKKTISEVQKDALADSLGLLIGDMFIDSSFTYMNFHYGNEIAGFSKEDSIIHIRREDSIFSHRINMQKVADMGVLSKLEIDAESSVLWARTILSGDISENRTYLLRIYNNNYDTIQVYQKDDSDEYKMKLTGMKVSREHRDYSFKDVPAVKISVKSNSLDTIYIRVKNSGRPVQHPYADFSSLEYIQKYDRIERFLTGSFFGIVLIVSFYYFIMFWFVRGRSQLFYSLFVFSIGLALLDNSGYGFELFWSDTWISKIDEVVFVLLAMLLYSLFGLRYLQLKRTFKFWFKVLKYSNIALLLSIIIYLPLSIIRDDYVFWHDVFIIPGIISLFVIPAVLLITSILKIRKKFAPAWYFLTGTSILLLLILFQAIFYPDMYSSYLAKLAANTAIYSGIVIQFLILSLGLGKRMRDIENERKIAQEKLILQLRENERLQEQINRELETKVKERTREIEVKNEELEEQKQEMTDSINYAKRIQTATLPPSELLEELLPDHFVFFKPRDIVSGDFHWIRQVRNFTVIVAADCTGHGVPGAFMSMLGMSFLNEQVSTRRFDSAGQILDSLRKKVKDTLKQEGKEMEQKDGMDLALAIVDNESLEMQFAGAFNPLYIIRKAEVDEESKFPEYNLHKENGSLLIEIKGDRQPISIHSIEKEFTTNTFQLLPDDTIYLFSDGYPDQIGGPNQKKFMTKNFKKLLLGIQGMAMADQKDFLDKTLSEWKGDVRQIDDIIIFGIQW